MNVRSIKIKKQGLNLVSTSSSSLSQYVGMNECVSVKGKETKQRINNATMTT